MVRATGQGLSHEYFLRDHLGNTRVVFGSNGEVLQATDYYAFGLEHTPLAISNTNRYLYNGKELQDETFAGGVRLGWYDYGARFYDPMIGRWHCLDNLSEKYYPISNYAYCGNNPIRNVDVDGNEFTDEAWRWVTKLVKESSRKQAANNESVAEKREQLKAGGLSERKERQLNRQISRLEGQNKELQEMGVEMITLACSDQVYDVKASNSYSTSSTGVGGASFNFSNGNFEMILPSSGGLELFSHELKHAYQFETGAYSVGPELAGPNKNLLYDKYDEVEAYNRGSLFGGTSYTINNLPQEYNNIATGPVDATTHPNIKAIMGLPMDVQKKTLQDVANRTLHAFRINGTTYYKPK